ncbi:MAG: hypothetical protein ACK4P5_04725 [Fimbriimonadales bacterium]
MLSKGFFVRWGWLSAFAVGWIASGWAQTVLKASPLLDEGAAAYRAVFRVELERRGSSTRGALVLHDAARGTLVYPLDLATNARKQLYVSLSPRHSGTSLRYGAMRLEWRGADGESVAVPLTPPLQTHFPIVVAGDMIGGLEQLNGQEIVSSIAVSSRDFKLPLKVYYCRPAALPEAWQALLELPVIVLVGGAETLSEAQWRALRRWLASGGTLMISVGSLGAALKATVPPDLRPSGIRLAETAAGVATLASQADGWQPLLHDPKQRPLLYRKPFGFGQLYLFMGNLEHPRWRNWPKLRNLFEQVIYSGGENFLGEHLSQRFEEAFTRYTQRVRFGGGWQVVALPLYGVGVWGLSVYLRRRRRLSGAFAPMAALAAAGVVAALFLAPRATRLEPNLLTQTLQSNGEEAMQIGYLYATLDAGWHTLTIGAEVEVLRLATRPNARVEIHFLSDAPTLRVHCTTRTHLGICFLRPVADTPILEARRQGTLLHLRNRSSRPLFGVQVFGRNARGELPKLIGQRSALGAGAHARIVIDRPDRFDTLWVQALSEHPIASAAMLDGKPIEEVSMLYCFVP